MQTEIEAKFLEVNHDDIRYRLKKLGAKREIPMRLMKRAMFDFPDKRIQNSKSSQRLRIRDEGNKVTVNHKSGNNNTYAHEIETTVGSFDNMSQLFEAIGLINYSYQEPRREAWSYKDCEVVLDEWPWLRSYIEIEGPSEESIKQIAKELGFNWEDAKFGSVDTVYCHQYPGMKKNESIGDIAEVRFDTPLPQYLKDRQKP